MRTLLYITAAFLLLSSCKKQSIAVQTNTALPIIGTWELIAATTVQGDSTYHKDLSNKKMLKIINASHFAFLNHDLSKGKDSATVFVAGGGTYRLVGDTYTEFLEYCNYREWEGNSFEFTVSIQGDTLTQKGIETVKELGINREITEVYLKNN